MTIQNIPTGSGLNTSVETSKPDLSAPLRDSDGGRRKSSMVPALLGLLIGGAGGYTVGGMMIDTMLPPPVIAAAPAVEQPATDVTAAVEAAPTDSALAEMDPSAAPLAPNDPALASVAPVTDPALATPPADLPVPQNVNVAPAVPSTANPVTPVTTTAGAQPNAAEMAIVQNAAVLDQLSQPNNAPVVAQGSQDAMLNNVAMQQAPLNASGEQDAVIRPLPKQYLIVKKNHDAEDVDSRLTAARTALGQNRNSGALELFNELYKDFPRDHRVLMGRAVALQKMGQTEAALSAYEEVLTIQPQNLEALTNMLGLVKKADPALAVQKLGELQEAYPYNADIAAQLGIAHATQGSYEEAARYLDIADALKPGSGYVLYNRAVLYDKMGRTEQAGELYRQVVRMGADGKLDGQLPLDAIKRRLSTMQ